MTDATKTGASEQRLKDLEAEADHARNRYELYKAKTYGPQATSPARLRELKRESERFASRLTRARIDA